VGSFLKTPKIDFYEELFIDDELMESHLFIWDFPYAKKPFNNTSFYVDSVAVEIDVEVIEDEDEFYYSECFDGPVDDFDLDDFFYEGFFVFVFLGYFILPFFFFSLLLTAYLFFLEFFEFDHPEELDEESNLLFLFEDDDE